MDEPRLTAVLTGIANALANAWPAKLLTSVALALFGPWREAYGALLVAMLIEYITGLAAHQHKKRLGRARYAWRHSVVKVASYTVVVIVVQQMERVVVDGALEWANDFTLSAVLLYLVGTEVLNTLQNVEELTGFRLHVFGGSATLMKRLKDGDYDEADDEAPTRAAKTRRGATRTTQESPRDDD